MPRPLTPILAPLPEQDGDQFEDDHDAESEEHLAVADLDQPQVLKLFCSRLCTWSSLAE